MVKLHCPHCKVVRSHFNKNDFLNCGNCGIKFHWRKNRWIITYQPNKTKIEISNQIRRDEN